MGVRVEWVLEVDIGIKVKGYECRGDIKWGWEEYIYIVIRG